eukprot:TRINITY_DN3503_c0_g2_i3.p1 TRINITY_DN3503_c0_g2~~TRINITY_DN3503_c0_g2_i3.p1  ORF type:complete len:159 (+),score=12.56 TRINITY_DN3503_c0_g2_i3:411-887(+)
MRRIVASPTIDLLACSEHSLRKMSLLDDWTRSSLTIALHMKLALLVGDNHSSELLSSTDLSHLTRPSLCTLLSNNVPLSAIPLVCVPASASTDNLYSIIDLHRLLLAETSSQSLEISCWATDFSDIFTTTSLEFDNTVLLSPLNLASYSTWNTLADLT